MIKIQTSQLINGQELKHSLQDKMCKSPLPHMQRCSLVIGEVQTKTAMKYNSKFSGKVNILKNDNTECQ
jgi:hypothetical protein